MEAPHPVPSGPEDVANFVFTTEVRPWRKHLKEYARQNRRQPTEAEHRLWQALRNTKLGAKFRRQHAIGFFIVDFICVAAKLISKSTAKFTALPSRPSTTLAVPSR